MKTLILILSFSFIAWLWHFWTPVHPKYPCSIEPQWQSVAERVAARVEQP